MTHAAGRRVPFGGGVYFRLYPLGLTAMLGRRYLRENDRPFMYYIHPREVSPDQPRLKLGLKERLIHYVNLDRNLSKLEAMLGKFRFSTARSYLDEHGATLNRL